MKPVLIALALMLFPSGAPDLQPAPLGSPEEWRRAQAPAQHQQPCKLRAGMLKLLADTYREVPIASGVTNNGNLVQVTSAPGGKTWTIIATSPQGVSCLVAAGEGWRSKSDVERGPAI